jgi:hypothetical protein
MKSRNFDESTQELTWLSDLLGPFITRTCCKSESPRLTERNFRRLTPVIPPPQFTVEEVAGVENIAAQQTVANVDTQFEQMMGQISTGGSAVANIANPAQQVAERIDIGMAHQQSTADNHLEQAGKGWTKFRLSRQWLVNQRLRPCWPKILERQAQKP